MADGNGASVGTISLSLIIDAELDKQLSALQKSIQSQWDKVGETAEKALTDSVSKAADKAVKPVEEVGKAVEKTVTQSVEKAVQKVEKPAEEVGKTLESSISESAEKASETLEKALVEPVKEAEKEAESLGKAINNKYEFGPGYSKEAMDFVNNYQPKSDKKKSKEKEEIPEIDVGSFEIPSEPIDRLNKSLELTNEKIELAQEKWKQLNREMAAMSDKDMAGEKGNAVIEKINAVETSMLKLQQQSEATKAKIDKAMQADAEAKKLAEAARQAAEAVNKIPESTNNINLQSLPVIAMLIDKMLQVKTAVTEAAASNEKVQSAVEKTTAVLDSGCKKIEQVLETADKAASKIIQPVSKVKNTLKTVGTAVNNSVIAPVKKLASSFASHFKRAEKPVDNLEKSVKKVGASAEKSLGKAKTSAGGFGKTIGGLGKSVKSALKSTFLMAGLYAAFRGIKSVMSDAIGANEEFGNSIKQIKGNLQVAFTPIVNAIMPALNTLASGLATATKAIASFISGLFGTTYKKSLEAAKKVEAVGKKAKENSRFLASFDEMNVASKDESDSSSSDLSALDSKGDKTAEGIGNKIREQIKKGFALLKKQFANVKKYFDTNFAPIFAEIGKKFAPVIEGFKDNMSKAWSDMATLAEPFKNYFTNNLTPALQTAFKSIGTIASGLGDTFNLVFGQLWDNVIFPSLNTMITTVLPLLTDQWTATAEVMTTLFETVKTIFDEVFVTGVMPILTTLQGVWSDLWITSAKLWSQYGEPMMEAIQSLITSVGDTVLTVYKEWIQPVIQWVCDLIKSLWDKAIKPVYVKVVAVVAKIVDCVKAVWNFLKPFVDWFVKTLGPTIKNVLAAVKGVFDTVFTAIGDIIGGIIKTFGGLIDFITGVFSGDWNKAWQGICNFFSGIWNTIWGVIKGVINLIIDGINMLWTGIYTVVKGIVDAIGGVAGAIGDLFGQDWHFSMPENPPLIPKLAKGGLAYAPTLAMVGDNRNVGTDPEVIAPLSKLKDIIGEGGDMTEVVLLLREILEFLKGLNLIAKGEVDGKTLYRLIVQLNKENTYRTGVNALG
jgi:phage-related protein